MIFETPEIWFWGKEELDKIEATMSGGGSRGGSDSSYAAVAPSHTVFATEVYSIGGSPSLNLSAGMTVQLDGTEATVGTEKNLIDYYIHVSGSSLFFNTETKTKNPRIHCSQIGINLISRNGSSLADKMGISSAEMCSSDKPTREYTTGEIFAMSTLETLFNSLVSIFSKTYSCANTLAEIYANFKEVSGGYTAVDADGNSFGDYSQQRLFWYISDVDDSHEQLQFVLRAPKTASALFTVSYYVQSDINELYILIQHEYLAFNGVLYRKTN